GGSSPPSDTYGYPTRMGLHGNHPIGGVLQRHAEVAVDLSLGLGVGLRQHADDVLEGSDERLYLRCGHLAARDHLAELSLQVASFSLRLGDPLGCDRNIAVLFEKAS